MTIFLHRHFKSLGFTIIALFAIAMPSTLYAFDISAYASSSVLSSGKWVRVQVTSNGIYRISPADIAKWGFSDINKIRVFGYGGAPLTDSLSIKKYIDDIPQTPTIRTASGIYFYGQSQETWSKNYKGLLYKQIQHPYSTAGYYFITENDKITEKAPQKVVTQSDGNNARTSFIDRLFYEKELYSPGMTGRYLLGDDFKFSTNQNFKFTLTDIVPGSDVKVLTAFAAKVMNGSSSVSFQYNGTNIPKSSTDEIYRVTSAAYEHVKFTETLKSFTLNNPNLTYSINYTYSGTLFVARLDYITINYTRSLNLSNNTLLFRGSGSYDYSLKGVSTNTRILDVSKSEAPLELNLSVSGSEGRFSPIDFEEHEYVAFNDNAAYPAPTFVENISNQDLHASKTPDMVIITPVEFYSQAQRIANMHETNDKMKVLVITPQVIYNEFSSGTPDVNAYRRLMKMYWDRGNANPESTKLGYLLLFGRCSYDNRQISDKVKKSAYPMLLNWQTEVGDNESSSYNTDDILGFLQDNSGRNFSSDILNIAVGRMPIKNTTEAKEMADKLLSYVSNKNMGTWKNNLLIIADDEDGADFMTQSETMIKSMKKNGGDKFIYNHVYTDAFIAESKGAGRFYPEARKKMFQKFKEGMLWVNYNGHANPVSWTHDGLLNIADINQNFIYKNYPLLYTATCEFTRWDSDDISGGELLFLNTRGGVIALMTASRVVYISENGVLNNYVGEQVFKKGADGKYQRIGDILKNGKNAYKNENKLKYGLIGDPAMRLNYPTYSVSLETVNGSTVNEDNQPSIEARSTVEVEGSIYNENGEKDNSFNGVIATTLYDAEESVETHGYGTSGKSIIYYDRTNRLYLGQDSVKNGSFKLKINMPSEISNNYSPAMLNFYAYNSTGIEANGASENLYVYGYDTDASSDTEGPEIKFLGMNSTTFNDGASINESPMVMASFFDKSGINVSTSGIGHQIALILDEKTTYTDVSQYYTPDIGGENGGSISYPISELAEGNHTLRLRVWDNAMNSSEKTISFNVIKGLTPELYDVYTTANPASVSADFYLKHNRPDALITVTLSVFDLMGRKVWEKTETNRSDMFTSFPITWNLCNGSGCRVSRGIYVYRAAISTDGVQESTKSKKIAVTD